MFVLLILALSNLVILKVFERRFHVRAGAPVSALACALCDFRIDDAVRTGAPASAPACALCDFRIDDAAQYWIHHQRCGKLIL